MSPRRCIFSREPRRRLNGADGTQMRDLIRLVAEFGHHLIGVFVKQRRARDFGGAVGEPDRVADCQVFTARRMIHFNDGPGFAQRCIDLSDNSVNALTGP